MSIKDTSEQFGDAGLVSDSDWIESIYGVVPSAILICDPFLHIRSCNKGAELLFGYDVDELRGQVVTRLFTTPFQGRFQRSLRDFFDSSERVWQFKDRNTPSGVRKDGERFLLKLFISKHLKGEDEWFTLNLINITEEAQRKQIQDMQNHVLEILARGADDKAVLSTLFDYIEHFVPDMLCSVMLLEDGKFLRNHYSPRLPQSFVDEIDGIEIGPKVGSCGTAAHTGRRVIVSDTFADTLWHSYRHSAKHYGLRACWSEPIISKQRQVIGTFAMYYREVREPDSFALKLIEAASYLAGLAIERSKQEKRNKDLQLQLIQAEKLEAVGNLASGIAHDLNNILTAVLGYLEVLQLSTDGLNDGQKEAIRVALSGSERASKLVNQILAYARKGTYQIEACTLEKLLKDSEEMFQAVLTDGVELSISNDLPNVTLRIDKHQMQQVLTNLVLNARQSMPAGGTIRVTATTTELANPSQYNSAAVPGEFVSISVIDTGVGIAKENVQRVFEPFFTTRQDEPCSGLGLAMVYGSLQRHGGWASIDSSPGKGTTMTLYLPALADDLEETLGAEAPSPVPIMNTNGTVMIVDDEEVILNLFTTLLSNSGYRPQCFLSPVEALAWFGQHHSAVDLVMLDMKLPALSGAECFSKLKAISPNTQIAVMSGYAPDDDVQRVLNEGAVRFFRKPFRGAEILKFIKSCLASKSSSDKAAGF